jgi:hypothetical protein
MDDCPKGDYSDSYYDGSCGTAPDTALDEHESAGDDVKNKKSEYYEAYEWAYAHKITTTHSFADARVNDRVTRAEMAKMIAIYAKQFTNKAKTPRQACAQFQDLKQVNTELQRYITEVCALGLMGYWSNGRDVKNYFYPHDLLTRAEVGVILSRLLRGNRYAGTEQARYQRHLQALREEEIMVHISRPLMEELRGNIFLMLQRMSRL